MNKEIQEIMQVITAFGISAIIMGFCMFVKSKCRKKLRLEKRIVDQYRGKQMDKKERIRLLPDY